MGRERKMIRRKTTRRSFMGGASATAALLASVKAQFPSGAFAQGSGPEVKGTKLGYIALTDAAPLVIAKEKGFFTKHGLPDMEVPSRRWWESEGGVISG
jgi:nitrate/nitrite transport system substrate-binding protein